MTDLKTGTVVLHFDASAFLLAATTFTAEQGVTSASDIIEMSVTGGHALQEFPIPETISEGTRYEERHIIND